MMVALGASADGLPKIHRMRKTSPERSAVALGALIGVAGIGNGIDLRSGVRYAMGVNSTLNHDVIVPNLRERHRAPPPF